MYATPMLMNSLSHGGSGLMGNMVGHSNHHQHPGSLSSMMHSTPSAIQNDIPEEDLPLPKFHEVFAFAMHASGKNGLKRGISGMGGKSSSNPAVAYDVSKRGKIEHNPGEETSGRWTPEEHRLFLEGVMLYGKDWKKMQPLIKTRSLVQIRTHAQKVFKKIGLKKFDAHTMRQFGHTQAGAHSELASIASSLATSIANGGGGTTTIIAGAPAIPPPPSTNDITALASAAAATLEVPSSSSSKAFPSSSTSIPKPSIDGTAVPSPTSVLSSPSSAKPSTTASHFNSTDVQAFVDITTTTSAPATNNNINTISNSGSATTLLQRVVNSSSQETSSTSKEVVAAAASTGALQAALSASTNSSSSSSGGIDGRNFNALGTETGGDEEDNDEDHDDQDHDYFRYLHRIFTNGDSAIDEEGQDIVNQTLAGGSFQQPLSQSHTDGTSANLLMPPMLYASHSSHHYHPDFTNNASAGNNMSLLRVVETHTSRPGAELVDSRRMNMPSSHQDEEDEDAREALFALAHFEGSSDEEEDEESPSSSHDSNNNQKVSSHPVQNSTANNNNKPSSSQQNNVEDDDEVDHFQIMRALHSITSEDGTGYE